MQGDESFEGRVPFWDGTELYSSDERKTKKRMPRILRLLEKIDEPAGFMPDGYSEIDYYFLREEGPTTDRDWAALFTFLANLTGLRRPGVFRHVDLGEEQAVIGVLCAQDGTAAHVQMMHPLFDGYVRGVLLGTETLPTEKPRLLKDRARVAMRAVQEFHARAKEASEKIQRDYNERVLQTGEEEEENG